MLAKDIMTTGVICVAPDATVEAIAKLLLENHISGVPVTNSEGHVLGVVSDTDLMHRVAGWPSPHESLWLQWFQSSAAIAAKVKKAVGSCARDIMTAPAITIDPNRPIAQIAEILADRHLRRVPVVADGKIVGIVSRTNLIQALGVTGAHVDTPSHRDQEIREQVLAHVRERQPNGKHLVNVLVADGVVHLWGVVDTDEEREATRLIAESIAGVRSVKSHVSTLDLVPSDVASTV